MTSPTTNMHRERDDVPHVGDGEREVRRHEEEVEERAPRAPTSTSAGPRPKRYATSTTAEEVDHHDVGQPELRRRIGERDERRRRRRTRRPSA